MHHSNISFTDEKVSILNEFLKQRLRGDQLTGRMSQMVILLEANTCKRHNMMCSIRLFRDTKSVKTLRCVISKESVTTGIFQRYKHFLVLTGFLVPGDMTFCDKAAIHAKGDNSY